MYICIKLCLFIVHTGRISAKVHCILWVKKHIPLYKHSLLLPMFANFPSYFTVIFFVKFKTTPVPYFPLLLGVMEMCWSTAVLYWQFWRVAFRLLRCGQTGARCSQSEILSPPIGFTLSMEPPSASRLSSAVDPVLAAQSAKVPAAVAWH